MSSASLTILGSDFIGLSLAQTLVQEQEPEHIALVGQSPTDQQKDNLSKLFSAGEKVQLDRFPEAFEGEDNIREVVTKTMDNLGRTLGHAGGRIVDLKVDNDGFVLLIQQNGDLHELYTHHLVTTAPPLLDVLERGLVLPGTDSAVTGLLLDKTSLDFNGSETVYDFTDDEGKWIWDVDFGLTTDEHGGTSNLKISSTGQAAEESTSADTLKNLVEGIDQLPEPTVHYNEGFDKEGWEDTSMPEGFVETKTETLRDLLGTALDRSQDPETLTHELEGLAGEIDSYSRFRSDPDLQRLRWKTLTAMNFAQPFLSTDQRVNA